MTGQVISLETIESSRVRLLVEEILSSAGISEWTELLTPGGKRGCKPKKVSPGQIASAGY